MEVDRAVGGGSWTARLVIGGDEIRVRRAVQVRRFRNAVGLVDDAVPIRLPAD